MHSAIFRWIERQKSTNSKMSLTYSHGRPQTPINKGLRPREGKRFSLTSPSLFSLRALTSCRDGSECDPKCEGKVREIRLPSRPSNVLCIRGWDLWCEKVRVKSKKGALATGARKRLRTKRRKGKGGNFLDFPFFNTFLCFYFFFFSYLCNRNKLLLDYDDGN